MKMAARKTNPDSPGRLWFAAIFGVVVLAGSLVCAETLSTAPADTVENVVDLRVTGNRRVATNKILAQIRTRVGRPLKPELIEDDVRRLNQTGWFINVRPLTQSAPGGRVVIYEVLERPLIDHVHYVGCKAVVKQRLEKESQIKAGDTLNLFVVEEARRRIEDYYHNQGFSNARVTIAEGNKASDAGVTFVINEGVKQRVWHTEFVGNTLVGDGRLKTQVPCKPGFFWIIGGELKREQIDEGKELLTAYYRSLGYFSARVGCYVEDEDSAWPTLVFVIDEGPRYTIRNVSFLGNEKFANEELVPDLYLHSGNYFNQADMQHDLAALRDRYGSVGYLFADVKADPRFLETPGQLDLVYNIREGDLCRIGKIDIDIQGENPRSKITTVLNPISFKPGDIADIRKIRDSERRIQFSNLFESNPQTGVMPKLVFTEPEDADVEIRQAGHEEPDPYRPARRAGGQPGGAVYPETTPSQPSNANPYSSEGSLFRGQYSADAGRGVPTVNAVPSYGATYSGGTSPVYSVAAQPNYGPLPPGQLPPPGIADPAYDTPGMFDGAPMLSEPVVEPPSRYIPIQGIAEETRTGRFMLTAGVNSDAGLMGSVVVDEQNFDLFRFPRSWADVRNGCAWRGAGQRFRMELMPGTEVQRYTINFQEPYWLNTRVSLGVSGFFYNRRFSEWSEERVGGRLALGYQLTPDLSGTLAYNGAKVNVYNPIMPGIPELDEVLGNNTRHGFEARLSHDTRDNRFLATQGHLLEFSFEQVVGTYQYPRGSVELRNYYLLHERPDRSGRHVLSLGGQVALTGSDTPIYDHYYAGGYSTIRGFDFRGVSPRDAGVDVGGDFMLLASAEYMFPITADDTLRGVVFCDTGTVESSIDDWEDKYRIAPGFGLRITVPAMGPAPIALDFGFPISSEPGDREEVFSFFVGFMR